MTIESESGGMGTQAGNTSGGGVKAAASTAASETSTVARHTVDTGRAVAHDAAAQVSEVAGRAKEQFSSVVHQARGEVQGQLEQRGQQIVDGLQSLGRQLAALRDGRPEAAGHVGTLVEDAQQRVQQYASSLQVRGPQGLLDDTAAFARRRPMTFLVAATAMGFAAGRMARAGASAVSEGQGSQGQSPTAGRNPSAGQRQGQNLIGGYEVASPAA